MTPEEFDRAYYELAQSLGNADDPILFRDRLLLLLLQQLDIEVVVAQIRAAELTGGVEELKTPLDHDDR